MSGQDNDDMECDLLARWASSCLLSLGQRSTDGVELLGCARHARQDAVAVLRSQPPPKARHKLVCGRARRSRVAQQRVGASRAKGCTVLQGEPVRLLTLAGSAAALATSTHPGLEETHPGASARVPCAGGAAAPRDRWCLKVRGEAAVNRPGVECGTALA